VASRSRRRQRHPAAALIGLLLLLLANCAGRDPVDADLLLRGGKLIDGSGAPARRADVAVLAGRILAIGDLDHLTASHEIDVSGLVVAPGFVDLHSHADLIVPRW